jgi:hypothetical protein
VFFPSILADAVSEILDGGQIRSAVPSLRLSDVHLRREITEIHRERVKLKTATIVSARASKEKKRTTSAPPPSQMKAAAEGGSRASRIQTAHLPTYKNIARGQGVGIGRGVLRPSTSHVAARVAAGSEADDAM